MKNRIHYEDDLFYLTLSIKLLHDGIHLNLDQDYFAAKIQAELSFIHDTLTVFTMNLFENTLLIQRADYLHILNKTIGGFLNLLDEILAGQNELAEALEPYLAVWQSYRVRQSSDRLKIQETLRHLVLNKADEADDVITTQEFDLLMHDDSESRT